MKKALFTVFFLPSLSMASSIISPGGGGSTGLVSFSTGMANYVSNSSVTVNNAVAVSSIVSYGAISMVLDSTTTAASYTNAGGSGDRRASITVTTTLTGLSGNLNTLVQGNHTSTAFYWNTQACSGLYVQFDFGSGYSPVITESTFYLTGGSNAQGVWEWQGSTSAVTWTTIGGTFTLGGSTGANVITTLSGNTSNYRYYRILGVSGNTNDGPYDSDFDFKLAAALDVTQIQSTAPYASTLNLQDNGNPTNIGGSLAVAGSITQGGNPLISSQWQTATANIYYPVTGTTGGPEVGVNYTPSTQNSGYTFTAGTPIRIQGGTYAGAQNTDAAIYLNPSNGGIAILDMVNSTGSGTSSPPDTTYLLLSPASHTGNNGAFIIEGPNPATNPPMLTVEYGGNIGIGVTSPSTKLYMSSGTFTIDGNVSPAITILGSGAPPDSQALCVLNGSLGHCTTAVGVSGGCTCSVP